MQKSNFEMVNIFKILNNECYTLSGSDIEWMQISIKKQFTLLICLYMTYIIPR